ncbi:hypothetical protein ACFL20_03880 [Spirochaetota bacterium]
MIKHPKIKEWENNLKSLFDEIDDFLEDKYGSLYPLHPVRPPRGTTSNKEMDGLFNVGASFEAGFGTKYGHGYVVDIHMSTLEKVPDKIRKRIDRNVERLIKKKLKVFFPGRKLKVARDGNTFKIYGDLKLGVM